jgi:hypothetical protein
LGKATRMSTAEIKQKLQEYIESGDEKLLKLMYAVAKEYKEDDSDSSLDDEEIRMLEERRAEYLRGKGKSYTWEEAKDIIVNKKKPE